MPVCLKANGAFGDQSFCLLLWLKKKKKSPALLTPLILPLILDMDQETRIHPLLYCLTVCSINKNLRSSTVLPSKPYPHPALSLDIRYCAWDLYDLEIVGQTIISLPLPICCCLLMTVV